MDIVSPIERSALMARIRSKDTQPERTVRRIAHSAGFRFRLHRKDLPGTPDLVFPRYQKVIFVHGCFWHRHTGCRFAYVPKSNEEFWATKFVANTLRDERAIDALRSLGWTSHVIWECEVRDGPALLRRISMFLTDAEKKNKQKESTRGLRRQYS